MIVRNEEANLPGCLASAHDLVDEIVVVDTGSTDRTGELAAVAGAQVHEFAWVDDFAAARNETLRHATGDWVFWLDADDRIDETNRRRLRNLFAGLGGDNLAYVMKCVCLPDSKSRTTTAVDHVRLFRNDPQIRWSYRVHEQILPAVRQSGGAVRWTDITIHHSGYQDPALRRRKLDRDLRLLQLQDAERPDEPFTLFNLGSIYHELGRSAEALGFLQRSLALSQPTDSIVRKLYALTAMCQRELARKEEALATCRNGRGYYADDAELLFQEGLVLRELGDLEGAEKCLQELLQSRPQAHFASVDLGLRGYKARHNLGVLYEEQGRLAEAEVQWRAAVAERGDFVPAWLALADLCLKQGRWQALDEAVGELGKDPQAAVEADVVRARAHLARKEFPAARGILEQTIGRIPGALRPRVILSHTLLQEGKDAGAAERALRDVLALDPDHAEARRNLSVLLRRQSGCTIMQH